MNRVASAVLVAVLVTVGLAGAGSPPTAAAPTKRYTQVTTGQNGSFNTFACARATDGTAICWGSGGFGQMGDGTTTARNPAPVAVRVAGTALAGRSIAQVDAGGSFACAVASGSAVCWGLGEYGGLGTGGAKPQQSSTAVPVQTSGTPLAGKTIVQVSAGGAHACALAGDGTLACWGSNVTGALGDGTTTDRIAPVSPTIAGTALAGRVVTQVSAGGGQTCVRFSDGNAACWGANGDGQLGDGTTARRTTAVLVSKSGTALAGKSITSIDTSLAGGHTCATHSDGTASCWGLNGSQHVGGAFGALGNGATASSSTAVAVRQVGTALAGRSIASISTGYSSTCAVATDRTLACWGLNTAGQLGRGDFLPTTTAVAVRTTGTALAGAAIAGVSASGSPCAVATDGRVACWGGDVDGALGNGSPAAGVSNVAVGVLGTGPFAPFASFAALITQNFRDLVGRAPSSSELSAWTVRLQGGTTAGALVASLRGSSENATNVDPVARLYWAYFDRIPDRPGLAYWIGRRRSGSSLSAISGSFAASAEFRAIYGSLDNAQFVRLVYANVLDRSPDAAGLAFWTAELNSGRRTRGAVMIGFSESSEFKTKFGPSVNVVVLYTSLLLRSPSTSELAAATARLRGGLSVAALAQEIVTSGPYRDRFA